MDMAMMAMPLTLTGRYRQDHRRQGMELAGVTGIDFREWCHGRVFMAEFNGGVKI